MPLAGIFIDRFGVKRMLPLSMVGAAISCFIFSTSQELSQLVIARLLMGSSASFSLLGVLTVIRNYFQPKFFPLLSGLTISTGCFGAILGGWILLDASHFDNWRNLMRYAGWFALLLASIFYFSVRHETSIQDTKAGFIKFLQDIRQFVDKRQSWQAGLYGGLVLTPIIAFASFWAVPFLNINYQFSLTTAEYLIAYVFIGYAVGAPVIALLAQRFGLRLLMIFSACLAAGMMWLLSTYQLPPWFLVMGFFLQGMTVGAYNLTNMYIKLTSPPDIAASAFSFNAMLSQLVGALMIWGVAKLILFWHGVHVEAPNVVFTAKILRHSMYLLSSASVLGALIAFFTKLPPGVKVAQIHVEIGA